MKITITAAVVLALWASTFAIPAKSQSAGASVFGVVADSVDFEIPGATVTATNTETKSIVKTTTDHDGKYNFSGLQPGTYSVLASLTGMNGVSVQTTLTSGAFLHLDLKMKVGSLPSNGDPAVIHPNGNKTYR